MRSPSGQRGAVEGGQPPIAGRLRLHPPQRLYTRIPDISDSESAMTQHLISVRQDERYIPTANASVDIRNDRADPRPERARPTPEPDTSVRVLVPARGFGAV